MRREPDRAWRRRLGRHLPDALSVRPLLVFLLVQWLSLGVTIAVLPSIAARARWDVLLAALVLAMLVGALRPVIAAAAVLLGWAGVLLGWLVSTAVLLYLTVQVTPGISADGFWDVFWASWLYAVLSTVADWLLTAGETSALEAQLYRTTRRLRSGKPDQVPGVVFVQIDGLSAPLLRWAVAAGNLPTLSRWL
ncbi:MAG: hypothetical protein QOC80_895, partial [Frankiaceae bacterium]|nr:hypothetical protein [Frankiaceae bacterium]